MLGASVNPSSIAPLPTLSLGRLFSSSMVRWDNAKVVRESRQLSCKTRGTLAHERTTNRCRKSTERTNKMRKKWETWNRRDNIKRVRGYVRLKKWKNPERQSCAVWPRILWPLMENVTSQCIIEKYSEIC